MGWTWDYTANNVDLPRLTHLNAYWKDNPPAHVLLKRVLIFLGAVEPPKGLQKQANRDDNERAIEDLMASLPMMG